VKKDLNQYRELFKQLVEGNLAPDDAQILLNWLGSKEMDSDAAGLIIEQLKQPILSEQINADIKANLERRLQMILASNRPAKAHVHILNKKRWLQYAAVFILLIGSISIAYFTSHKQTLVRDMHSVAITTDIIPGKNGALLTLADGKTMVIDSLENGVIADQNGSKILLRNGQLVYTANNIQEANKVVYNTIATPKGRQFQLTLCDGTKVWLDAASSLRYPTTFTGKSRYVEITGEAYFEVAKNPDMPFHVKINDNAEIEVLGTHFNVNAYENEHSINTTLLEGAVRFYNGNERVVLKPGQQAQASTAIHSPVKINNNVDIDKVIAWKNGFFDFDNATLEEVMRQLERWYDIDVIYKNGIPPFQFIGKMQKNLNLSEVLHGLEVSGVHFKVEGRKVLVYNN